MTDLKVSINQKDRIKADLILLLVAIIWGTAFVAQRLVAKNLSVFLFNGSRFLLGALVLTPLLYAKRKTIRI